MDDHVLIVPKLIDRLLRHVFLVTHGSPVTIYKTPSKMNTPRMKIINFKLLFMTNDNLCRICANNSHNDLIIQSAGQLGLY